MMKNRQAVHDFRIVSGYDAELDGPDPQWGRVAAECAQCKEKRRILATIAEVNAGGGCLRDGPDNPWQRGDLVVTRDGALDEFCQLLPGGRVVTWNAGGSYHENGQSDLTPYT